MIFFPIHGNCTSSIFVLYVFPIHGKGKSSFLNFNLPAKKTLPSISNLHE